MAKAKAKTKRAATKKATPAKAAEVKAKAAPGSAKPSPAPRTKARTRKPDAELTPGALANRRWGAVTSAAKVAGFEHAKGNVSGRPSSPAFLRQARHRGPGAPWRRPEGGEVVTALPFACGGPDDACGDEEALLCGPHLTVRVDFAGDDLDADIADSRAAWPGVTFEVIEAEGPSSGGPSRRSPGRRVHVRAWLDAAAYGEGEYEVMP